MTLPKVADQSANKTGNPVVILYSPQNMGFQIALVATCTTRNDNANIVLIFDEVA